MDLADPPTPTDLIGRQPYRLTGADVTRMVAAGILHEDARMELWNGQLITMSPRGPLHAKVLETLIDLLTTRKPLGTAVRVQDPIALGTYYQPEPDVVLVNRDREASDRSHPRPQDIHLIIEVSDTTLRDDLGPKARLYAAADIREYWVVDVASRSVTVHLRPEKGRYTRVSPPYEGGTPLKLDAFPDVTFPAAALFD